MKMLIKADKEGDIAKFGIIATVRFFQNHT